MTRLPSFTHASGLGRCSLARVPAGMLPLGVSAATLAVAHGVPVAVPGGMGPPDSWQRARVRDAAEPAAGRPECRPFSENSEQMIPSPPRLGVNIDHVATLREARGTAYPDPLEAAFLVAAHGGDGITMHLREDRRHIHDRDVLRVREHVNCRLNLEMAATSEMIGIALRIGPDDCCIVPERREELTTEGGLDVAGRELEVGAACEQLRAGGIRTSLFIDPIPDQIDAAARAGTAAIELHTGRYAEARTDDERGEQLEILRVAAERAVDRGLIVNAGHGLHYQNVAPVAALPAMHELNIGHAVVARAVMTGLPEAVARMRTLIHESAGRRG